MRELDRMRIEDEATEAARVVAQAFRDALSSCEHSARSIAASGTIAEAPMVWAESIKSSLGSVYHVARENGRALCSNRVRLDMERAENDRPSLNYICKRCEALQNNKVSR